MARLFVCDLGVSRFLETISKIRNLRVGIHTVNLRFRFMQSL
jgi:hypothetical protein